jgi:predicted transcriptional regulator
MKKILISIRPQWCEKIASGKKTIEVRKSAPKEVPFKAYIYCTKGKAQSRCGKVIGEFVCNKVATYPRNYEFGYEISENEFNETALTAEQFVGYGNGGMLYGWHISDLKIYDKPRELSEFCIPCKVSCENCKNPLYFECSCEEKGKKIVTRPPQSYMRVEELKEV